MSDFNNFSDCDESLPVSDFNILHACDQHVEEVKLLLGSETQTRLTPSEGLKYRLAFLEELKVYARLLDLTPILVEEYQRRIAEELYLSRGTVKTDLNNVFSKIKVEILRQKIPCDPEKLNVGYGRLLCVANILHSWQRAQLIKGSLSKPNFKTVTKEFEETDISLLLAIFRELEKALKRGFNYEE